jgi:hypothetical protein
MFSPAHCPEHSWLLGRFHLRLVFEMVIPSSRSRCVGDEIEARSMVLDQSEVPD